jgi:phosphatidylethanolamine/phosphatidyl-N-methylethanolamine N-methyltransferase
MFEDYRLFYSQFRSNFSTTGAIAPSSPLLAKAIVLPLIQRPARPIAVLEVGPGTGSFTHAILRHLRLDDSLDIYELNPQFYSFLIKSLDTEMPASKGIRLRIHNADIRNLRTKTRYDFIISGLPFYAFDPQTVSEILDIYLEHLSPAGVLSYFEYVLTPEFKSRFLKPAERERIIRVAETVRSFVQKYQYSSNEVWWNLPPAKARYCRKPDSEDICSAMPCSFKV